MSVGSAIAGGVATGLVGGIANAFSQASANRAQRRMFNESMAFQKYQYEDQKNYNSAKSQVSRLRAAGLNPSLAMANGTNAGQAAAVSSPSPASQGAVDYAGALNAGVGMTTALQQGELVQSQQDLNAASARDANASAEGQEIKNLYQAGKELSEIAKNKSQSDYTAGLLKVLGKDLQFKEETMDYRIRQEQMKAQIAEAEAHAKFVTNQYLPEQLQGNINQTLANAAYLYRSGAASLQQAHAAVMNSKTTRDAFTAQYGDNKDEWKKFHKATLDYLLQQKDESESREFGNVYKPFLNIMGNDIPIGASYQPDFEEYKRKKRTKK